MKRHPKFQAEHQRLQQQLEVQKHLIQQDWQEVRASLSPLQLVKNVIGEAADTFRDNGLAIQTTRLALTVLPSRARNPWLGIAAQLALPMLLRNLPHISAFVAQKADDYGLTERMRSLIRHFRSTEKELDIRSA